MAAAAPKVIGKGSYGAIVSPALPNVDEHGHLTYFGPDMISKVMLRKEDYDKMMEDEAFIQKHVPSLTTGATPYRRVFHEYNISGIPGMHSFIQSKPSRNGVYVARMPNLGLDLKNMVRIPGKIDALRASVTPAAMFKQILKLMHIVKGIRDVGLIHADVRETNVMCSATGDMTIIDFDWLMTPKDIQKNYPVYFYCHPPESIFLLDKTIPIDNYIASNPSEASLLSKCERLAERYMIDNDADYFWNTIVSDWHTTRYAFAKEIAENMLAMYQAALRDGVAPTLARYRKIYYNTVDSYGLAVALRNFMIYFFYSQADTKYRRFLRDEIFDNMLSPDSTARMTIDDAIDRIMEFARRELPELQLGEEVSVADELARLNAIADLASERRHASEERRTLRQQVEGLALLTKHLEGLSSPKATPDYAPLPPSPRTSSSRRTGSNSSRKSSGGARRTKKRRLGRGTRKQRR
jgi:hypothetical protein